MTWIYDNQIFNEEMIQDHIGFVYMIENLATGKRYIGRKLFTKAATKTIKGKRKKIRAASDWENYWGSNKVLQEDVKVLGPDHFKRTITRLCKTRSEAAYWETFEIFKHHALMSDDFYNEWVTCKISAKHVRK